MPWGLYAWVRASHCSGGGSTLECPDLSGQGHHPFVRPGHQGPSVAAAGPGGHPTLRYDDANDWLRVPGANDPQATSRELTVLVVGQSAAGGVQGLWQADVLQGERQHRTGLLLQSGQAYARQTEDRQLLDDGNPATQRSRMVLGRSRGRCPFPQRQNLFAPCSADRAKVRTLNANSIALAA